MLCFLWVAAFVAVPTVALVAAHTAAHGFSALQAFLALFECVNLLICIWEIALFTHARDVANEYHAFREKWGTKGQLPQPMILFEDASLSDVLSLRYWATIWSTYALFDSSYQDTATWGFWVDTGNGFTTLIPTVLSAVGMTWDFMPPRLLGLVCFIAHYQEFYGTVIYFCQYVYNERFVDQPTLNRAIVVGSNGYWMIAPAIAMWAFYTAIDGDTLEVFRQSS